MTDRFENDEVAWSDTAKVLGKIRALIDAAEGQERSAEKAPDQEHRDEYLAGAAKFRQKAEMLMRKYRIDQEEALAKDPTSVSPILRDVVMVSSANYATPYRQNYLSLYDVISRHVGVRVHYAYERNANGNGYDVVAHTVGYEGDADYAEVLYTTARMVFAERLEPKVNASMSDAENVYRLRSAGMERVRVAEMVWGNRDKANLAKVGRMYKAECARRGEQPALDGRGVTGKVYREQYAEEFVWSLATRLHQAQDAAGQMGGALVLHGRKERVDEAFYERYPQYRPQPALPAGDAECEDCKRSKSKSGKCKAHKPYTYTAADAAASRRYNSVAAQRGREAGASAARHVQIDRTGRDKVEGGYPQTLRELGL